MESAAIEAVSGNGGGAALLPGVGPALLRGLRTTLSRAALAVALLLPSAAAIGPVFSPTVAVAVPPRNPVP